MNFGGAKTSLGNTTSLSGGLYSFPKEAIAHANDNPAGVLDIISRKESSLQVSAKLAGVSGNEPKEFILSKPLNDLGNKNIATNADFRIATVNLVVPSDFCPKEYKRLIADLTPYTNNSSLAKVRRMTKNKISPY